MKKLLLSMTALSLVSLSFHAASADATTSGEQTVGDVFNSLPLDESFLSDTVSFPTEAAAVTFAGGSVALKTKSIKGEYYFVVQNDGGEESSIIVKKGDATPALRIACVKLGDTAVENCKVLRPVLVIGDTAYALSKPFEMIPDQKGFKLLETKASDYHRQRNSYYFNEYVASLGIGFLVGYSVAQTGGFTSYLAIPAGIATTVLTLPLDVVKAPLVFFKRLSQKSKAKKNLKALFTPGSVRNVEAKEFAGLHYAILQVGK